MSKTYSWQGSHHLGQQIHDHEQARRKERAGCKAKAKATRLAPTLRTSCSGCDATAACRVVENSFLCGACLAEINRS